MTSEIAPESEGLGPGFKEQMARVIPRPSNPVVQAVVTGRTLAVEELQLLIAKIRVASEDRPLRTIGVLSAAAGEGKTTLAMGLASVMAAEPDRRVLLIEADLRKPAIEGYLGLPNVFGLSEWLRGSTDTVTVRWVTPPGFALLAGGRSTLDRPELLGSKRMEWLLEAARQSFDFVVVDCPPVTPVADAVILQNLLDGFVFVVRAGHCPRETIVRAASRLKHDKIIGTVFNSRKQILPSYDSYGYRHYGDERYERY